MKTSTIEIHKDLGTAERRAVGRHLDKHPAILCDALGHVWGPAIMARYGMVRTCDRCAGKQYV